MRCHAPVDFSSSQGWRECATEAKKENKQKKPID